MASYYLGAMTPHPPPLDPPTDSSNLSRRELRMATSLSTSMPRPFEILFLVMLLLIFLEQFDSFLISLSPVCLISSPSCLPMIKSSIFSAAYFVLFNIHGLRRICVKLLISS